MDWISRPFQKLALLACLLCMSTVLWSRFFSSFFSSFSPFVSFPKKQHELSLLRVISSISRYISSIEAGPCRALASIIRSTRSGSESDLTSLSSDIPRASHLVLLRRANDKGRVRPALWFWSVPPPCFWLQLPARPAEGFWSLEFGVPSIPPAIWFPCWLVELPVL